MTRSKVREHIFKLVFRIEFTDEEDMQNQVGLFFDDPVGDATEDDNDVLAVEFSPVDEAYIRNKFEMISAKLPQIDEKINEVAKGWSTKRMSKVDLAILRLGTYEILFDEDIPMAVAINEAVELAKQFGQDSSASFVNGILAGLTK